MTRDVLLFMQQMETCSVVFGNFRQCGTVFYRVGYGAVHTFSHTLECMRFFERYSTGRGKIRGYAHMQNARRCEQGINFARKTHPRHSQVACESLVTYA